MDSPSDNQKKKKELCVYVKNVMDRVYREGRKHHFRRVVTCKFVHYTYMYKTKAI